MITEHCDYWRVQLCRVFLMLATIYLRLKFIALQTKEKKVNKRYLTSLCLYTSNSISLFANWKYASQLSDDKQRNPIWFTVCPRIYFPKNKIQTSLVTIVATIFFFSFKYSNFNGQKVRIFFSFHLSIHHENMSAIQLAHNNVSYR